MPPATAANLLATSTSPYLQQHRDNPVHWRPWGDAALAEAKASGKPILLSVGYAACHWCHVMAHESFENPDIAGLMNQWFVNIKVDREERPDLDYIYQAALAMLGQQGGWPLTMFLTPEGKPFWGGTYFPPDARFGRPGFPDVLAGIHDTWQREPEKITKNVKALQEAMEKLGKASPGGGLSLAAVEAAARRLVREVDPFHGGIGDAPKFPQTGLFTLFWRVWLSSGQPPFRNAVMATLVNMCQGGIYDHLAGGFARYSVDAEWLVPHFEKMLYDNAQLIQLLTQVWQGTDEPLLKARVTETVEWVLAEMRVTAPADPGGAAGFASTLDADSEGEEGRYYVWTRDEVEAVLGQDAALFAQLYDVTPRGNWEGKNILNRLHDMAPMDDATQAVIQRAKARLKAVRDQRARPGWDDKVLADWNGMMIAALAEAGFAFNEPRWMAAAQDAYRFVVAHLRDADGRLIHSWRQGEPGAAALLDDVAHMARAAITLAELTGEAAYLADALRWVDEAEARFGPAEGGYFLTAHDAPDAAHLVVRPRHAHDNAVPSGNAIMAEALTRLHFLTGEAVFADRARAVVTAFAGEAQQNLFPLVSLMNAAAWLQAPQEVVIVTPDAADPQTEAGPFLDILRRHPLPNRSLMVVSAGTALPSTHPAHGKGLAPSQGVTAYVCVERTCSLPLTTPADFAAAVRAAAGPGMGSP